MTTLSDIAFFSVLAIAAIPLDSRAQVDPKQDYPGCESNQSHGFLTRRTSSHWIDSGRESLWSLDKDYFLLADYRNIYVSTWSQSDLHKVPISFSNTEEIVAILEENSPAPEQRHFRVITTHRRGLGLYSLVLKEDNHVLKTVEFRNEFKKQMSFTQNDGSFVYSPLVDIAVTPSAFYLLTPEKIGVISRDKFYRGEIEQSQWDSLADGGKFLGFKWNYPNNLAALILLKDETRRHNYYTPQASQTPTLESTLDVRTKLQYHYFFKSRRSIPTNNSIYRSYLQVESTAPHIRRTTQLNYGSNDHALEFYLVYGFYPVDFTDSDQYFIVPMNHEITLISQKNGKTCRWGVEPEHITLAPEADQQKITRGVYIKDRTLNYFTLEDTR